MQETCIEILDNLFISRREILTLLTTSDTYLPPPPLTAFRVSVLEGARSPEKLNFELPNGDDAVGV